MRTEKVAVAMSGGVDSGVAAALVVKAGYKAAGFHMHLWAESSRHLRGEAKSSKREHLGGGEDAARKTAHKLKIPFYIVDLEKIFKKRVVDYFLKEYGLGRTPNPCIQCNRLIKFGELLHHAKKLGYDYLATGHYAKVVGGSGDTFFAHEEFASSLRSELTSRFAQNGRLHLFVGKDKKKDQSYFLYNLTQKQLAQVMFPVGDCLKKEVVAMAKKWKLPVAERPESQEICFFPETDYRPFLKRQIREKIIPGEVVDTKGKVVGKHQGIPLYTIGQRHGFEIRDTSKVKPKRKPISLEVKPGLIPPFYVIAKDVKKNQLIVGFGKEAERKEFLVKEVNWIDKSTIKLLSNQAIKCKVRIRHQGELMRCEVKRHLGGGAKTKPFSSEVEKRRVEVILDESERGVAPGQAAVFYKGEEVLGGGIISLATRD